jgi:hypothetical protein
MADSPITSVLRALEARDLDAIVAMFAGDGALLRTDGRHARGTDEVRTALQEFFSPLRRMRYRISSEWNPEPGVWIAQLSAEYDLGDLGEHGPYPRAIVLREGPGGIGELSVYGSHELPLTQTEPSYHEVFAAGRWMPTL